MPEFETINEANIACVKCCGGSKVVGSKLWPEKTVEAAQRHLLACLNEDKPERLSPDQLVYLMRLGREVGCHDIMRYMTEALGYSMPNPIDPKDEVAELLRISIEQRKAAARTDERIERLLAQKTTLRSAA
jgi:hypothetical protein